jgi:hypothetical protein
VRSGDLQLLDGPRKILEQPHAFRHYLRVLETGILTKKRGEFLQLVAHRSEEAGGFLSRFKCRYCHASTLLKAYSKCT